MPHDVTTCADSRSPPFPDRSTRPAHSAQLGIPDRQPRPDRRPLSRRNPRLRLLARRPSQRIPARSQDRPTRRGRAGTRLRIGDGGGVGRFARFASSRAIRSHFPKGSTAKRSSWLVANWPGSGSATPSSTPHVPRPSAMYSRLARRLSSPKRSPTLCSGSPTSPVWPKSAKQRAHSS